MSYEGGMDPVIGSFVDELDPADRARILIMLEDACGPYWCGLETVPHITRDFFLRFLRMALKSAAGEAEDVLRRTLAKAEATWRTS